MVLPGAPGSAADFAGVSRGPRELGPRCAGYDRPAKPEVSSRFASTNGGFDSHLDAMFALLGTEHAAARFSLGAGAVF